MTDDKILQLIKDRYKNEPVKISVTYTTSDCLNGYGYAITKETKVQVIKRICIHCKVVDADKKDEFCPVHGWHKMGIGWVEEDNAKESIIS